MSIAIGIDPGAKGGVALIDGEHATTFPYSDEILVQIAKEAAEAISHGQMVRTCVEKVGAFPGQGSVSMFTFGKSAGFIEGVLTALEIPYQLVPPQTWKKEFSLNKTKELSNQVCKRLFPNVSLLPTEKCRKDSDGMSEALLMAEYARRKL